MKRKIAFLCAAVMLAGLITACSGSTGDNSSAVQEKTIQRLSNPDADENAQRVYEYICENYGINMLTCQQESTWMSSPEYEMEIIEETTGKLPAIRGLDFMNDDFDGVVQRSKEWHERGGLVTICWHTGINGKGYQESLNDDPDFDKLLTEGTPEYEAMIANWDKAANALAELRDAGIPVLWRPFHEFDGKWFWWGKGGEDNFIRLWQMMYDRYTNEFGLTNLIWVLGYSGEVKKGWYPGDEYCDIIGSDTYDDSTNVKAWKKLKKINTSGKPMAFHECGNLPSVEDFEKDGCLWSWFMIWHTDYIAGNDKDNLKAVYNSDKVITLDELSPELFGE
ncbi:MAG: glycosyl hydrolase [Huintestinicola sp.]